MEINGVYKNFCEQSKVGHFAILPKNCILNNMSEKTLRHIFLRNTTLESWIGDILEIFIRQNYTRNSLFL